MVMVAAWSHIANSCNNWKYDGNESKENTIPEDGNRRQENLVTREDLPKAVVREISFSAELLLVKDGKYD